MTRFIEAAEEWFVEGWARVIHVILVLTAGHRLIKERDPLFIKSRVWEMLVCSVVYILRDATLYTENYVLLVVSEI
jgi:hypothetical protein